MKKLASVIAALAAFIVLAFPNPAAAMWVTQGIVTNPTAGQVLADTTAISGGGSTYTFVLATTVAVRVEIAVRNAANNADVIVQNFLAAANSNLALVMPVDVPPGGRIVMRTPSAATGSVQASILKDGAP